MIIVMDDPFPGRCKNYRNGVRCLHYDLHDSKCVFPEKKEKIYSEWDQTTSYTFQPKSPEPWTPPWEEEDDNT